jgi:hypothetical protein
MPEASIVVETYTHAEGGSTARLETVLREAARMVAEHGDAELLVLDLSGDEDEWQRLHAVVPEGRRVLGVGLGYDGGKAKAADEARGEFVLYLDGDCLPAPGWLEAHLKALRAGIPATGGFTRYDGGFFGALCSVLDFGFLLPPVPRDLDCYASNNSGFRRELLVEHRTPDGPLRCRCYAYAQLLLRQGTPIRLVPEARVRHEPQPFRRERYRQGFDIVASAWTDPALPQARVLRLGVFAAPLLYANAVLWDWLRIARGGEALDLVPAQRVAAALLAPLARLIDLAGMLRALAPGGRESGVGLHD